VCSAVVIVAKVSDAAAKRLITKLCNNIVQPRKQSNNSDAACICLKSVAAEMPAAQSALLAQTAVPILLQGLLPQVRTHSHTELPAT
jgi:hypothetical protein